MYLPNHFLKFLLHQGSYSEKVDVFIEFPAILSILVHRAFKCSNSIMFLILECKYFLHTDGLFTKQFPVINIVNALVRRKEAPSWDKPVYLKFCIRIGPDVIFLTWVSVGPPGVNLSEAEATFIQSTRMQRCLKTIWTLPYWYSLESSRWVVSDEYPLAKVSVIFKSFFALFWIGQISHRQLKS